MTNVTIAALPPRSPSKRRTPCSGITSHMGGISGRYGVFHTPKMGTKPLFHAGSNNGSTTTGLSTDLPPFSRGIYGGIRVSGGGFHRVGITQCDKCHKIAIDEHLFDSLSTGVVDNVPPRNPCKSRVEQPLTGLSSKVFHRGDPPTISCPQPVDK